MRARLIAVGIVLAVALVAVWILGVMAGTSAYVSEDDPRWNCRTMGNRICGPVEESK